MTFPMLLAFLGALASIAAAGTGQLGRARAEHAQRIRLARTTAARVDTRASTEKELPTMANHKPPDRYRQFADFADLGTGADEFEGARRFTRPSDRTNEAPVRTAKHATGASDQITHQETDQ